MNNKKMSFFGAPNTVLFFTAGLVLTILNTISLSDLAIAEDSPELPTGVYELGKPVNFSVNEKITFNIMYHEDILTVSQATFSGSFAGGSVFREKSRIRYVPSGKGLHVLSTGEHRGVVVADTLENFYAYNNFTCHDEKKELQTECHMILATKIGYKACNFFGDTEAGRSCIRKTAQLYKEQGCPDTFPKSYGCVSECRNAHYLDRECFREFADELTLDTCAHMGNKFDACRESLALTNGKQEECEDDEQCLVQLALEKDDISRCSQFAEQYQQVQCFTEFAVQKNNPLACGNISDPEFQEYCLLQLSFQTDNVQSCSQLQKGSHRSFCARTIDEPSLAPYPDRSRRNYVCPGSSECIINLARDLRNPRMCDLMKISLGFSPQHIIPEQYCRMHVLGTPIWWKFFLLAIVPATLLFVLASYCTRSGWKFFALGASAGLLMGVLPEATSIFAFWHFPILPLMQISSFVISIGFFGADYASFWQKMPIIDTVLTSLSSATLYGILTYWLGKKHRILMLIPIIGIFLALLLFYGEG